MSIVEFLSDLRSLGVELKVHGGKLHLNAPKGVLTPSLRAELTARKEEILVFLKAAGAESRSTTSKIPSYPRGGYFPLSFSQERLWFLDQLEPGNHAYNMPAAIRIKGRLNRTCMEQALNEILARHEVLRTNFDTVDSQPVQIIAPKKRIPLVIKDLSGLPPEGQSAETGKLTEEEAKRPFDLRTDLLVRATLLVLNEQEYIFLLTLHHIVSDGWSISIFAREFRILYNAFLNGEITPLPPLPIQYADFARWQREWLQGDRLSNQLEYWKQQLNGELPQLEALLDKPRSPAQSIQSGEANLELPASLTRALSQLSQEEDATLFMTLLAGFKILLHRHTGLEDIIVGSPIAGRNQVETENLIGFFLNTLALRTDVSGNPSFRELIRRVKKVAMDAYSHQDIPFEKLLVELQPERDLSRSPIFQIFINMLNLEGEGGLAPGLTVEILDLHDTRSKFDLTLYIHNWNGVLKLRLVYNRNLFNDGRMTSLLAQYEHILKQIAVDASRSISNIPIMPDSELEKFRVNIPIPHDFVPFNITDSETIASRFKQIVELFPDHSAVQTDTQHLNYRDLYLASSRVALNLRQKRFTQTSQVALLFEHDAPMIVGIFGTLLAGRAYVPLDPTHPPQRLAQILIQSRAGYILTNTRNLPLAKTLSTDTPGIINIDELQPDQEEITLTEPNPDDLAYILFTSGSTGNPKGVMQSHRNVLLHIRNYTNNLRINASDHLTLLSSYGFDAAVMAVYGALLNGATLHPFDVKAGGVAPMKDWIQQDGITIYHSTPTLYRYFMDAIGADVRFPTIRIVVLGGEEVVRSDVDAFKHHFSKQSYFINGLGPTESTLAFQNILSHDTPVNRGSVPVGYPVEGIELHFLNEAGQPAQLLGEIIVQGQQVALGYWDLPDLTEAAFQTTPDNRCFRRYRTGDFGRLLPDGRLIFLGRKDEQVKIRGFRIELGEIETTLKDHPSVQQAVVVAREVPDREKQLFAYVVPASTRAVEVNDLRSFLLTQLPNYMIPAGFVLIDEIPVTPNGKIDRRRLPTPDPAKPESTGQYAAPRDEVEQELAGIFAAILKLERVGIHDNFFDLGGHSLLATKVISHIREQLGVDLPLRTLFEYPTPEGLALAILRKKTERVDDKKLIDLMAAIENLSDEETKALLDAYEVNPESSP
jgi:amino acid adenylation domain-containing protein